MSLPLEGVRILAVSQFGAGPYGTMLLADLGAEVIKIEDPTVGGDVSRSVPPYSTGSDSLFFQSFNRNKKSLSLNLRTPEGKRIFRRLVETADLVFNNLRGDQPAKLGLDYTSLKEVNPKIVCCSLSAFGTNAARASEPGYDYLLQALAGYMSLTGEPDGPPTKCSVSVIDHAAGIAAALGSVARLFQAKETEVGGNVEVSLLSTAISMLTYLAAWSLNRNYEPQRLPNSAHQSLVPAQNLRTRDGYLVLFCAKEKFWLELCELLERPELARDPRFASFESRRQNRDALIAVLQEILSERTTDEWVDHLRGRVPCARVNSLEEALADADVVEQGMIVEVAHPEFGAVKEVASPITLDGTHGAATAASPLGADTEAVLTGDLGFSPREVEELKQRGVI